MHALATALVATLLVAAEPVMPVGGGNALTLPAQRHLVRVDLGPGRPPAILLAAQQQGAEGRGLSLFRSDDGARTFRFVAAIQPDARHPDRAELLVVGRDVALVYSYEGPALSGSSRHDVVFQWWRYQESGDTWGPGSAVVVFDATTESSAFSRALLARDSLGRLWVQAFRLEADGGSTAVLAVSTDGGATFQPQPDLARVPRRGGGRLLSLGTRLLFLYGMHDGFVPARFRVRDDSAALGTWSAAQDAFPEGIYHGAALSAVADGRGGMHLVYKDETERLFYRRFDGSTFGPRQLVEDVPDWALQPATTRVGDALYVFYNARRVLNTHYSLTLRVLREGAFSPPLVLDDSVSFKGYPNALELQTPDALEVPCLFGNTRDAASAGMLSRVGAALAVAPPPDGGGPSDGGVDTGGGADAGVPGPGTLLFADDFTRTSRGLGPDWTVQGLWRTDGARAVSDLDGLDLALAAPSRCLHCEVEVRLQAFGDPEAGVVLRAQGDARYVAVLRGDGQLEVRRQQGTSTTVLGTGPSGLADPAAPLTLSLATRGTGPVELTVSVNGVPALSALDSSPSALTGNGLAGLSTLNAGHWFDDFRVRALAAPDAAPVPDAGAPDAGAGGVPPAPDAGSPPGGGGPPHGGSTLTPEVVHTNTTHELLGVDRAGTVYALAQSESRSTLYASTDGGRSFAFRGRGPSGASFQVLTALGDGTLLAQVILSGVSSLARSTDGGATWRSVLTLQGFRAFAPGAFAELEGVVLFLEHQTFTGSTTPVRLWASTDRGGTWTVRFTFSGHRHGRTLLVDTSRGVTWALLGDGALRSAIFRSTDAGHHWTRVLEGVLTNALTAGSTEEGALLYGMVTVDSHERPRMVRLSPDGMTRTHAFLPGPAWSFLATPGGGALVGAARTPTGTLYGPSDVSAVVMASPDGERWTPTLRYERLDSATTVRADPWGVLPSGEVLLRLEGVKALGSRGRGFQILRLRR